MNFLPIENKKAVKKEYFGRLAVIIGIFIFSTVSIGVVAIFIFSLFLGNQQHNFERQLAILKQTPTNKNIEENVAFMKELNFKISFIESYQKENQEKTRKSEAVKKVLDNKPVGVFIENFTFNGNNLRVFGLSVSRNNFLNFINSLGKEKSFKKINSPPSNLFKEKNLEFELDIEL